MGYLSSFFNLILSLRVEPVVLLTMTAVMSRSIVMQQLMQDKLCQFKYKQPVDFCTQLSELESGPIKNQILADASSYLSWKESLSVLPYIIFTLFAGSWCDRFRNGRRYVLLASLIGLLLDTILLLLNTIYYEWDFKFLLISSLPSTLMGSGYVMVCVSYITANTEEGGRSFRFLVFEVFSSTGMILGFFTGPRIMAMAPFILPRIGLRNCADAFLCCAILLAISVIWAWFRVLGQGGKSSSKEVIPEVNQNIINGDEISESTISLTPSSSPDKVSLTRRCLTGMASVFALQDLRDIRQTLTMRRPDNGRRFMWIMIAVHAAVMLPLVGCMYVAFPLMERLYKWNSQTYGLMMALAMGLRPLCLSLFVTLIVRRFPFTELQLVMVGVLSNLLGLVCIASITNEYGFYTESVVAALTGAAVSGNRSFLSLIVDGSEITKVFCIMQIIEATYPFLGSSFLSTIFRATISFYPTLMFHCCAFFLLLSLAAVAHIDLARLRLRITDPPCDASAR